jgi:hypothetical protein
VTNLEHPDTRSSENCIRIVATPLICGELLFHGATALFQYSTTIELISPFKIIERFDLGFRAIPPR